MLSSVIAVSRQDLERSDYGLFRVAVSPVCVCVCVWRATKNRIISRSWPNVEPGSLNKILEPSGCLFEFNNVT